MTVLRRRTLSLFLALATLLMLVPTFTVMAAGTTIEIDTQSGKTSGVHVYDTPILPDVNGKIEITVEFKPTMNDLSRAELILFPVGANVTTIGNAQRDSANVRVSVRGTVEPPDFQVQYATRGPSGGPWASGETYTITFSIDTVTNTYTCYIKDSTGKNIVSGGGTPNGMPNISAGATPFAGGLGAVGVYVAAGGMTASFNVLEQVPPEEPGVSPFDGIDPKDGENGDYYISMRRVAGYHDMAYDLIKPMYGQRNTLTFTVTPRENVVDAFISFQPVGVNYQIQGDATRNTAIWLSPDGTFQVRDNGTYKRTGVAYQAGQVYAFEVKYNFGNSTYSVKIDGTPVAENYKTRVNATYPAPENIGIIAVGALNTEGFEMRNISVGMYNLVDNDAQRNVFEANPTIKQDGSKTYYVGPTRKYQKPQDVIVMLEAGDTLMLEGDCTYPAPLYILSGNGANSGKPEKPITIKGLAVNDKKPVIRAVGILNVIMLENVANWELDGVVSKGSREYLAWARGEKYNDDFSPSPHAGDNGISYRGIYYLGADADDLVIRNCEVYDSYQGIHCSGTNGDMLVEYSDVHHNGTDGYGHNLYLASKPGATARIQYNYIHDTVYPINGLKTRFSRNEVYYNVFYNNGQGMELISMDNMTHGVASDSDVVGNLIVSTDNDRRQGMRVGGDGTGPGTYGRYRIANNTFVFTSAQPAYLIRTYMAVDSVEVFNNIFFSAGQSIVIDESANTNWVNGRQIVGMNNWMKDGTMPPDGFVNTVFGANPGFVDMVGSVLVEFDFNLLPNSPVIDTGVPLDTLATWPATGWHQDSSFINPLLSLDKHPVDPASFTVTARPAKALPDIGAYGTAAKPVIPDPEEPAIKAVTSSNGNGQANIDFAIRSANGKGYTIWISESIDGPFKVADANFNSKGAHVKKLENGKVYYAYIEYISGNIVEKSNIVTLQPSK